MRLTVRSIGLVSMVVLARLLLPADFGLVVLASMLVGLVELASEFEFATYLIREQRIDRSYYDTAWTLSLLRGGLVAVVLVVSASAAADFFAEPRLQNVLYALALASLITGLANIGIVDFQKSLNFDRDFRLTVQTKLVSFAITMLLAVLLRNYWALVIGILSGRCAALLFSYTMHPYRPRISLVRTGAILRFSEMGAREQSALLRSASRLRTRDRQDPQFGVGRPIFARARNLGDGDIGARRSDRSRDVPGAFRAREGTGRDATYLPGRARDDRDARVTARRRYRADRQIRWCGSRWARIGWGDPCRADPCRCGSHSRVHRQQRPASSRPQPAASDNRIWRALGPSSASFRCCGRHRSGVWSARRGRPARPHCFRCS